MLQEKVLDVLREHGSVEGCYLRCGSYEFRESREIKPIRARRMRGQLSDVRAVAQELLACMIDPHSHPPNSRVLSKVSEKSKQTKRWQECSRDYHGSLEPR